MKKIFVILWAGLFCLENVANEPSSSWVALNDGKYTCQEISIRIKKARIVLPYGETMVVPLNKVKAFSINGSVYDKLPLYKKGNITDRQVFMELICESKGCRLYRYGYCKSKCIKARKIVYNYYIYKGENLHLATNSLELPNACIYGLKKCYK